VNLAGRGTVTDLRFCNWTLPTIPPGEVTGAQSFLAPEIRAGAAGDPTSDIYTAGAILYFAVAKITGYEIGLISIVVGLLVGKAVKMGAGGRGGWRYQALAIALCYLSISGSYGAFAISEMVSRAESKGAKAQATPAAPAAAGTAEAGGAGQAGAVAPEPAPEQRSGWVILGQVLLLFVSLPVLVGLESPMTFLLVAIALWEAWKLNVAVPFEASGPFAVGEGGAALG